jgi:hypothetical protein
MKLRKALLVGAVLGMGINYGAEAAKVCLPCPAGSYSGSGTGGKCKACDDNTKYCPGSAGKQSCPSGRSFLGSSYVGDGGYKIGPTSAADCKLVCTAGQYYNGAICQSCSVGTYQSASDHQITSCTGCPVGTYNASTGQSSCTDCQAGYRCPGSANRTACSGATYQSSARQSGCTTCNTWSTSSASAHTYCPSLPGNGDTSGRVQGYCSSGTGQVSAGTSGKAYTGSTGGVPGGGQYCHCRAESGGAWSSWVYYYVNGNFYNCAGNCAYYCSNNVSSWGGSARW